MFRSWTTLALLTLGAASAYAQSTPRAAEYYNASWSPDSRTLTFDSNRDGKSAIYRIEIDGTGLRRLTEDDAGAWQSSWAPDGRRIIFSSDREGSKGFNLMNTDGTQRTLLVPGQVVTGFLPRFSPNGQWIAFGEQLVLRSDKYVVGIIRTDGTGRRLLTDTTRLSEDASWSADGERIFFQQRARMPSTGRTLTREEMRKEIAEQNAMTELFSIRLDGSDLQQVTHDKTSDCCAQWMRDGSMYFKSGRDGTEAVYVMGRDGTVRRVDLPDTNVSPDGRWVAYTKQGAASGVYLYEVATKRERRLIGGFP